MLSTGKEGRNRGGPQATDASDLLSTTSGTEKTKGKWVLFSGTLPGKVVNEVRLGIIKLSLPVSWSESELRDIPTAFPRETRRHFP